jgi:Rad4 beta-hairpin domain 3
MGMHNAGTVHLRFPRLAAVCRALGADFAHAMAGFEIKGGRSVPAIEGVVVCAEDEGRVMEAYHTAERWVFLDLPMQDVPFGILASQRRAQFVHTKFCLRHILIGGSEIVLWRQCLA